MSINPLSVACPACQSPANRRCTHPTETTRKAVGWFHMSRENLAYDMAHSCVGSGEG